MTYSKAKQHYLDENSCELSMASENHIQKLCEEFDTDYPLQLADIGREEMAYMMEGLKEEFGEPTKGEIK